MIRDLFAVDTISLGVSLARKNGKSSLIASLILACLLNLDDFTFSTTSSSGRFSLILREQIRAFARSSGFRDQIRSIASPAPGGVTQHKDNPLNSGPHLASGKSQGQGESVNLAVLDEAGLFEEKDREQWASTESSVSAKDGKFLAIGTQRTGELFEEMRDHADLEGRGFHLYETPQHFEIDDPEGWELSNPGLASGVKSHIYMQRQAEKALRNPSDRLFFEVDELNRPREARISQFINPEDVEVVLNRQEPPREGPVTLGFDLGGSVSMTAAAAFWPFTGRLEVYGAFPSHPSLKDRGEYDGVGAVYEVLYNEGELWTIGNRLVDAPEFIKRVLGKLGADHIPECLGSDRFRVKEAEQVLIDTNITIPHIPRGTGAAAKADGSYDCRAFESRVLEGPLHFSQGKRLLVRQLMYAKTRTDGGGNPKLDKTDDKKRIDVVSASVIAVGLGNQFFPDSAHIGNPEILVA